MIIFIKMLDGSTESFVCWGSWIVLDLKAEIREKFGIPTDQQRLMFAGKQLKDEKTLWSYGVRKESTLNLMMRLSGGALAGGKKRRVSPAECNVRPDDPQSIQAVLNYVWTAEQWFTNLPQSTKQAYFSACASSNRSTERIALITMQYIGEFTTVQVVQPHPFQFH